MPLHSPVIIKDARPDIVDAPMMLIYMIGQGACGLPFYLFRWPIHLYWMDVTMQPCDCWMSKTINCWRSVDGHLWAHLRDILTVIGCSTIGQIMHTVSIGSQYTMSMYYDLNPRYSRDLSFWATTIHVICIVNDIGLSRLNALGRSFTA